MNRYYNPIPSNGTTLRVIGLINNPKLYATRIHTYTQLSKRADPHVTEGLARGLVYNHGIMTFVTDPSSIDWSIVAAYLDIERVSHTERNTL